MIEPRETLDGTHFSTCPFCHRETCAWPSGGTCDGNQPTLHEQAILTLQTFQQAASLAGLAWYLHAGTLLGAVRDQDFAPGDADDIDIAVLDEDFDRVAYITDGGLWFREMGRFIYKERVEGVKLELHDNGCHIDVSRLRLNPATGERYDVGTLAIGGEKTYCWNVYPGEHFRGYPPFEVVTFHGIPCRVPRRPREVLAWRYGPDWETPIDRANFDWCARVPCDGIRLEYGDL